MYSATRDFLVPNEAITINLPEFAQNFTVLQSTIREIQLISETQKEVRTGLAKDKKDVRNTLIALSADNSRKVFAFAKIAGNKTLMDSVSYSISDFQRMTDVDLKDYAENMYKKAEAIIGDLATYGITPETQKALGEAIKAHDAWMEKPRMGITEKRQATVRMGELFEIADTTLDKIDAIIEIVRITQSNFYVGYKTARRMVDFNTGVIALKATAVDIANGKPLNGAVFTFASDGTSFTGSEQPVTIRKKTAAKGSFHIRNMRAGAYKVVIKKTGYKVKEVTIDIPEGERSDLKVELEKV
ncbi:MAG: carboxypeptidase-like regulatory domain-containing protein [Chloroflexota bacterium]|nr:carboxypeptidase-like regulatory domain-containing protein [Chloroflexota bacterium]